MFLNIQTCWKWKYLLSQLSSGFFSPRSPIFSPQLTYLKNVVILVQIWSTKSEAPAEASREACALEKMDLSAKPQRNHHLLQTWQPADGCRVPTGWNDVK